MDFGMALNAIKSGGLAARTGWNGKGMWIGLCREWNGSGLNVEGSDFRMLPFIYMRTAQADLVPWLASQTDMLADDWLVISSAEETQSASI